MNSTPNEGHAVANDDFSCVEEVIYLLDGARSQEGVLPLTRFEAIQALDRRAAGAIETLTRAYVNEAQFHVGEEDDAQVDWVNPIQRRQRQQQGHHDHYGGKHIHDTAQQQQRKVEEQQEHRLGFDVGSRPRCQAIGYLGVRQDIGQAQRDPEQKQHAANHPRAADDQPGCRADADFAMNPHREHQRQRRCRCRGLHDGGPPSKQGPQADYRQCKFPASGPDRWPQCWTSTSPPAYTASAIPSSRQTPPGAHTDQQDQQKSGRQGPNEQIIQWHLCHHPIQNEWKTGRQ